MVIHPPPVTGGDTRDSFEGRVPTGEGSVVFVQPSLAFPRTWRAEFPSHRCRVTNSPPTSRGNLAGSARRAVARHVGRRPGPVRSAVHHSGSDARTPGCAKTMRKCQKYREIQGFSRCFLTVRIVTESTAHPPRRGPGLDVTSPGIEPLVARIGELALGKTLRRKVSGVSPGPWGALSRLRSRCAPSSANPNTLCAAVEHARVGRHVGNAASVRSMAWR